MQKDTLKVLLKRVWKISMMLLIMVLLVENKVKSQEPYSLPILESKEYDRKLKEAQQYRASTVYYHNGSFHSVLGGVGPDNLPEPDNANREFPWGKAGGIFDAKDTETIKLEWYPANTEIKVQHRVPILGYNSDRTFGTNQFVVEDYGPIWTYPKGTIFFAVLFYKKTAFEVHALEKVDDGHGIENWDATLWRPYPSLDDYAEYVGRDALSAQPQEVVRVRFNSGPNNGINELVDTVFLPRFEGDFRQALSRPFRDATGVFWQGNVIAPTTLHENHIIPPHSTLALIGHSIIDCRKCHSHVGRHVSRFQLFNRNGSPRDWYGRVRGSDGIFSRTFATYFVRDASNRGYKLSIGN